MSEVLTLLSSSQIVRIGPTEVRATRRARFYTYPYNASIIDAKKAFVGEFDVISLEQ